MAKSKGSSGNDFIGIGIGLEHDAAASKAAESEIVKASDQISKSLSSSLSKSMTPLKSALMMLTKAVNDLQSTIASTKFDALTKGLDAVNQKTVVMAKNAKESAQSIDKAVDATTKKLADFFKIDEGTAKFKKLGEVVNQAMQFDGVDKGVAKITKMKDMMIQVGNEVAKVNSKAATELMANAKPDLGNVKLFSIDKYKAEVEKAKAEYQKLLDSAAKGNLGSASNITNLGKQFEGYSLFTQGNNPIPNNTLEFVKNLRKQIAEMQRSTDNTINFNKLYDQAEKLQNKFGNLVPPVLKQRLDALTTTNWEDTIRGTAKFRQEIDKVKYAVDSLGLSLKDKGEKLWNGIAIPKTYVTNVNGVSGAYAQAVKEDRQREEIKASQYWAAIKNTENFDKRSIGMNTSIAQLARDYDTVIKKVQEFNRLNGTSMSLAGWDKLDNLNKITDFKGLSAAKNQMADLRKQFADFLREQRVDDVLGKRFEKMAMDITRADATLATFKHNIEKMNKTFDNVTSRTVSNDPKLPAVTDARANLTNVMATASVGAFTPAKAAEITEAIRKVQLAMQDFAQTGSRIKDSTGSPFDNLFKGIPAASITIDVMRQRIQQAIDTVNKGAGTQRTLFGLDVVELGKIDKQLKMFGYTLNRTTMEVQELRKVANQTKGMFSWLPESMGGMATRLAEFYSLRTVIFGVSAQFRDATRSAIALNQSVHDILAISGESKSQFSAVSDSIYNIAKASRFTTQEVASLMQVLAQAGVAGKDLPIVSAQVGMFASATAADPKTAADLVTTAMNVYALKATETTRITNAMAAALNLSKLEAGGLATAFNYLGPQSAQLGMSMEQTLGIIANMAQSGIKASTIGTGGSQLLKEFAAPKERLRNLLSRKGITADQINPMKNDFADIVDTLKNGKNGGVSVDELFQALDTRVARAAATAINLTGDSFRLMTANITGTHAALIAYDKSMEGAKARMNVVSQSFNELATQVGGILAPALIAITDGMKLFIDILSDTDGKLIVTTAGVTGVALAIVGLQAAATKLIALNLLPQALASWSAATLAFQSVVKSTTLAMAGFAAIQATSGTFAAVRASVKAAGAAMLGMITPVKAVAAGIGVVVAALVGLVYWMGESRREYEAKQKAIAKELDDNDRLVRSYNAITSKHKEMESDTKKYVEARRSGNKAEQEAVANKYKDLTLTADQTKELFKLIPPTDTYTRSLISQNKIFEALLTIKERTIATNSRLALSEAAVYNANVTKARISAARSIIGDSEAKRLGIIDKSGGLNYQNLESYLGDKPDNVRTAFEKNVQNYAVKPGWLGSNIGAVKLKDSKEFSNADGSIVEFEGVQYRQSYDAKTGQLALSKLPEQVKPKTGDLGGGKPKYSPKEHGNAFMLELMNLRREALTKETRLDTLSDAEIKAFYGESKVDVRGLIKQEEAGVISLQTMLEQIKTLKDIDEAIAQFSGGRNIDKIDKQLPAAKYNKEYAKAEAVDAEKLRQEAAKRQQDQDKILEQRRKQTEDYVNKVIKLDEETDKRIAEAKKRNNEKILQDGYRSDSEREQAYNNYLAAEYLRLESEAAIKYDGVINAFRQKMSEGKANAIQPGEYEAYQRALAGKSKYVTDGYKESTEAAGTLKHTGDQANQDILLKIEQQRLQVSKSRIELNERDAVGAEAVKSFKIEALEEDKKSLDVQAKIYAEKWRLATTVAEEARWEEELSNIEQKRLKINRDIADLKQSGWEDFKEGARSAWNSLSDVSKMTKDLGSSLTNSFTNGLSSTVSNTFTTLFNPDTQKINELNAKITELRTQKTTLESEIATIEGNTSKTPEEIKNLNDKKVALDNVNNSLKEQEAAVRKQKDAWSTFSEGLKGIMKTILETLQRYIAEMLVVWAVQKMIGLVGSMFGGDTGGTTTSSGVRLGGWSNPSSTAQTFSFLPKAEGGIIKGYAEGGLVNGISGGLIPESLGIPGKDSVPIMAMPNEYIIPSEIVRSWGAGHFEKYRNGTFKKMAEGGLVGGSASPSVGSKDGQKQEFTLQIVNMVQGQDQVPSPGEQAQQIVNVINNDIARRGPTYRTIKAAVSS